MFYPRFDGALFSITWKEALWAKFSMVAPLRLRPSVDTAQSSEPEDAGQALLDQRVNRPSGRSADRQPICQRVRRYRDQPLRRSKRRRSSSPYNIGRRDMCRSRRPTQSVSECYPPKVEATLLDGVWCANSRLATTSASEAVRAKANLVQPSPRKAHDVTSAAAASRVWVAAIMTRFHPPLRNYPHFGISETPNGCLMALLCRQLLSQLVGVRFVLNREQAMCRGSLGS